MIKILHAADFHMDSPFESLPPEKAAQRRKEQRVLLSEIAHIVNNESVQLVLLSGDLFDSSSAYGETKDALLSFMSSISVPVFISPGNHDYISPRSPYSYIDFPDNVHVFKTPRLEHVDLPALGCRVWGAGYTSPRCPSLLDGSYESDGLINIMTLHAALGGDAYCPVSENDIAASGLDYLALGHVHSFSGILSAGSTYYAYPGCPEGRGFDECGEKGVIVGTVGKNSCDLSFRPLGGRLYRELNVALQNDEDISETVLKSLPSDTVKDIYRINLTGTYDGKIDVAALAQELSVRFFSLKITDKTKQSRNVWDEISDTSLKGLFLSRMKAKYDSASDDDKEYIMKAVRYGLAAIENREEL